MTTISLDEVLHLAELSKLELTDEEAGNLRSDIANILEYVEMLNELDTNSVEPTYQVTDRENISREDIVVATGVTREQLLALSQDQEDNQLKVPKVL